MSSVIPECGTLDPAKAPKHLLVLQPCLGPGEPLVLGLCRKSQPSHGQLAWKQGSLDPGHPQDETESGLRRERAKAHKPPGLLDRCPESSGHPLGRVTSGCARQELRAPV